MEIKLPSSGLLLIVLSLWRLIQLSTVKFAYSAFNTLSLKFSPRTLLYSLPRHLQFLGYVSGFRWSYCFRKAFPDHLSYVIPSRLGVLCLVGGRVHLDDLESHRKGSEILLSEAPLVLNLEQCQNLF
ncbi:hypothetical protein TNCV_2850551 [Trichonephila clavipes]|nr:hypothetical protein TNCV_2850551 [Trichonephila clavipes]